MGLSPGGGKLFSGDYRKLLCLTGTVAEASRRRADGVPEKVVQSIWRGGYFRKQDAFTEDGRQISVVSPGDWNSLEGPDFKGAVVELSGEPVHGDVEIHLNSSDWVRHGHDSDPAYRKVILHAVVENDLATPYVKRSDGEQIPQLVFEKLLDLELSVLSEVVDSEMQPDGALPKDPLCRFYMKKRWDSWERIERVLDTAGDERMLAKAGRLHRAFAAGGIDQAAYELIMESLGYSRNKVQFLVLARRLPFNELKQLTGREQAKDVGPNLMALFLGVGGLLGAGDDEYFDELKSRWEKLHGDFGQRAMTEYEWHFVGGRPTNSPLRRMAAASQFLAANMNKGLLSNFLRRIRALGGGEESLASLRKALKQLESMFTSLEDAYWSYRLSARGERLGKPQRLVGQQRFRTILINAIIPLFLLHSRNTGNVSLERSTHSLFRTVGRLAPDRITRRVSRLVFGTEEEREVVANARRQQGLHQLYRDFCAFGDEGCRSCAVKDALAF